MQYIRSMFYLIVLTMIGIACDESPVSTTFGPAAKMMADDSFIAIAGDSLYCRDQDYWSGWCKRWDIPHGGCEALQACSEGDTAGFAAIISDTIWTEIDPQSIGLVRHAQLYSGTWRARWGSYDDAWWLSSHDRMLSVHPDSIGLVSYPSHRNDLTFKLWGYPSPFSLSSVTSSVVADEDPPVGVEPPMVDDPVITCEEGTTLVDGVCVGPEPPMVDAPVITCEEGTTLVDGVCVGPEPPMVDAPVITCEEGTTLVDGVCVGPEPPMVDDPVITCEEGTTLVDGVCVGPEPPIVDAPVITCEEGTTLVDGVCVGPEPPMVDAPVITCEEGTTLVDGVCVGPEPPMVDAPVITCEEGTTLVDGVCVGPEPPMVDAPVITCEEGTTLVDGVCVGPEPPMVDDPVITCEEGTTLVDGVCVGPEPPMVDDPVITCEEGTTLVDGVCVGPEPPMVDDGRTEEMPMVDPPPGTPSETPGCPPGQRLEGGGCVCEDSGKMKNGDMCDDPSMPLMDACQANWDMYERSVGMYEKEGGLGWEAYLTDESESRPYNTLFPEAEYRDIYCEGSKWVPTFFYDGGGDCEKRGYTRVANPSFKRDAKDEDGNLRCPPVEFDYCTLKYEDAKHPHGGYKSFNYWATWCNGSKNNKDNCGPSFISFLCDVGCGGPLDCSKDEDE